MAYFVSLCFMLLGLRPLFLTLPYKVWYGMEEGQCHVFFFFFQLIKKRRKKTSHLLINLLDNKKRILNPIILILRKIQGPASRVQGTWGDPQTTTEISSYLIHVRDFFFFFYHRILNINKLFILLYTFRICLRCSIRC